MKQGYALVTKWDGCIENITVYEREEDARSQMFDSIKEQVSEDSGRRQAYELYQKQEPTGKFAQFFEGLDTDDIGLTLDAYAWLLDTSMITDIEMNIFPCDIHGPKPLNYFH